MRGHAQQRRELVRSMTGIQGCPSPVGTSGVRVAEHSGKAHQARCSVTCLLSSSLGYNQYALYFSMSFKCPSLNDLKPVNDERFTQMPFLQAISSFFRASKMSEPPDCSLKLSEMEPSLPSVLSFAASPGSSSFQRICLSCPLGDEIRKNRTRDCGGYFGA